MALFENFPYTNIHELNLDWIVKIAKDFLEQYTHIQQLITDGETSLTNLTETGLASLQEKADALEALLQQWYDTHSEDIAQQLASALADLNAWYTEHQNYLDATLTANIASFNQQATNKAEETIDSIPADYTEFYNRAVSMVLGSKRNDNIAGTIYADMNTLPAERIVFYADCDDVLNKPTTARFSGYVMTFHYQGYDFQTTNKDFTIQLAQTCGSGVATENNTIYFRAKYTEWSGWVKLDIDTLKYIATNNSMKNNNNIANTVYSDLDTLPSNQIVFYAECDQVLHKPMSARLTGYVITVHYQGYDSVTTNKEFSVQMLHTCGSGSATENNTLYIRAKYSAWSEWYKVNQNNDMILETIRGAKNDTNITGTVYADMNTLPANKIVMYADCNNVLHKPVITKFSGYIISLNYNASPDSSFTTQIAITSGSGIATENNIMYTRTKYTEWSEWYAVNRLNENTANAIAGLKNFTVVGDSIARSISYPTIQTGIDVEPWGSLLAKQIGRTCNVYAQGGITSGAMLQSQLLVDASENVNNNQYAFVALGINDINLDVSQDEYIANMTSIINRLLTTHRFVFAVPIANGLQNDRNPYNARLKTLCDSMNHVYYLDIDRYGALTASLAFHGHFSSTGYAAYADVIKECVNKVLNTNTDFIHGLYD